MARLKDDVGLAEANASMSSLSAALERERPVAREAWSVSVEPFRNNFVRDNTKRGLWLLLGAVGFLLLIACANVANLLLARGTTRQRELAIRTSMGATRGAIVRQLLAESLVVSLAGGALGALLASNIIDAIVALMPAFTLPSETEITLSVPVLVFTLAVCVITGLLAGSAPAWQASRVEPASTLKEGGRSVSGARHRPPSRARGAGVRARADVAGWWRDGRARAGENHDRRSRHSQERDPHDVAAAGSRAFGDARGDQGVLSSADYPRWRRCRTCGRSRCRRGCPSLARVRPGVRDRRPSRRRSPAAAGDRHQHGHAGVPCHVRYPDVAGTRRSTIAIAPAACRSRSSIRHLSGATCPMSMRSASGCGFVPSSGAARATNRRRSNGRSLACMLMPSTVGLGASRSQR